MRNRVEDKGRDNSRTILSHIFAVDFSQICHLVPMTRGRFMGPHLRPKVAVPILVTTTHDRGSLPMEFLWRMT